MMMGWRLFAPGPGLRAAGMAVVIAATLAGCTGMLPGQGPPADVYTLTPKSTFARDLPRVDWQLVVEEPLAAAASTPSASPSARARPTSTTSPAPAGPSGRP
jgi:ABC-type uncharacterized transport system auxiliary subunit